MNCIIYAASDAYGKEAKYSQLSLEQLRAKIGKYSAFLGGLTTTYPKQGAGHIKKSKHEIQKVYTIGYITTKKAVAERVLSTKLTERELANEHKTSVLARGLNRLSQGWQIFTSFEAVISLFGLTILIKSPVVGLPFLLSTAVAMYRLSPVVMNALYDRVNLATLGVLSFMLISFVSGFFFGIVGATAHGNAEL